MGGLRTKDHAMLTLSSAPTLTAANAYARADATEASREAASARAVKAVEASNVMAGVKASGQQSAAPNITDGLSTVAVAGALSSIPAALGRMRDIAMAASSGTLTDADRATLQAEYADLNKQVASVVGTVSASQDTSTSTDKGRDSGSGDPRDAQGAPGSDDATSTGYQSPDRAVRARTASPTSTVATAHADSAHDPAKASSRMAALRAATVAQFQQHSSAPERSRLSVVA